MSDVMTTEQDLSAALADPVPRMGEVPDTTVELLLGLPSPTGMQRVAIVREMTGEDEEFLASLDNRSKLSYTDYVSALLKRTVISIGDLEVTKIGGDMLDSLIVADRDILFLGVIKATYGNFRVFNIQCPHCSETLDLNIDIDEKFPIQGTAEEAAQPLSVKLKNGTTVQLRIPTSGDSKYVQKKGKNTAEQNTLMLGRCALVNVPDREAWARKLNIADRAALVNALLDVKIGPKLGEVNDPCPHCGETIELTLDWVSLLFG